MAVSKRLRFEILRRDNHACRYCGRSAPEVKLTIDHVLATALGGSDTADNLVTACADCNSGKSATPPDAAILADVAEDAVRWARARTVAAERLMEDLNLRHKRREAFLEKWNTWKYKATGEPVELPEDWPNSIDNFTAAGLPHALLLDALDLAMRNAKVEPENTFRYMCGIAWNRIGELQAATQAELNGESGEEYDDPWSAFSRDELEEYLCRFDEITERFLVSLPVWVHERAERATEHDWHCAGEPDAQRLAKLPDVLRHVGNVLKECEIQPVRAEVD